MRLAHALLYIPHALFRSNGHLHLSLNVVSRHFILQSNCCFFFFFVWCHTCWRYSRLSVLLTVGTTCVWMKSCSRSAADSSRRQKRLQRDRLKEACLGRGWGGTWIGGKRFDWPRSCLTTMTPLADVKCCRIIIHIWQGCCVMNCETLPSLIARGITI